MSIEPELAQFALSSWLEQSLRAKLGRCRRCMVLSGVLLLASWLFIYLLASLEPPIPALLVMATVAAVLITLLTAAHVVAFTLRLLERSPALTEDPPSPLPDSLDVGSAPQARRGGCGCGAASRDPSNVA
jgi:hypothetical protein